MPPSISVSSSSSILRGFKYHDKLNKGLLCWGTTNPLQSVSSLINVILAENPSFSAFPIFALPKRIIHDIYASLEHTMCLKIHGETDLANNGIAIREGPYLLLCSKHAFDKSPRILSTVFWTHTRKHTQPSSKLETESAGKIGFCTLDGLQLRAHIRKQIGSSRRLDDMQHKS